MLLPYQRWRCLQQAGGAEAPFDWLAAGGTPAVFTRHQQLISRAWKST